MSSKRTRERKKLNPAPLKLDGIQDSGVSVTLTPRGCTGEKEN
jgi:hypothetical protein